MVAVLTINPDSLVLTYRPAKRANWVSTDVIHRTFRVVAELLSKKIYIHFQQVSSKVLYLLRSSFRRDRRSRSPDRSQNYFQPIGRFPPLLGAGLEVPFSSSLCQLLITG